MILPLRQTQAGSGSVPRAQGSVKMSVLPFDCWRRCRLSGLLAGLGTSVLAGHSSPEQAQAVIDYHLRRLFPAYRPA